MRLEEIKNIEELYILKSDSFKSEQYELQIMEGFRKEVQWSLLTSNEKIEIRKRDLMKKYVFKELYSDLIILYEESVIELVKLIMEFLDEIESIVFDYENISKQEFILFRLKNMLYIELYSVNKRENLQYSGHVLFEEIIKPIFIEIENTVFYVQYKLENLREIYKKVSDLYKKDPYKK